MDPYEKRLLEENLELSRENNKILKRLQRGARISSVMRAVYWIVILGAAVGTYYYVQPYLEQLLSIYSGVQDGIGKVNDFLH